MAVFGSQIATHTHTHTHTHTLQDRCNALFKQVHEEKHLKGRANDAVAAACLYIACRQEEVPRSFKEICAVSRHPKKEIGKCFKLITRQSNPIVCAPVNTSDFMVTLVPPQPFPVHYLYFFLYVCGLVHPPRHFIIHMFTL